MTRKEYLDRENQSIDSFAGDNRAQGGAGRAVEVVVALVVGGLMAAFLLPLVIEEIQAVDTASWGGGAASLWGILPVMMVLAIFLYFVTIAVGNRRKRRK